MKIKDVSRITERILERKAEARDDDMLLYFEVCHEINPVVDGMAFKDVMRQSQLFGIPNFESVSRSRRHLVEERPELRGSKRAIDARFQKYKEIKEYAQS